MEMRPFSPVDECLKLCGIGFCAYLAYRLGVKVGMMKPKSLIIGNRILSIIITQIVRFNQGMVKLSAQIV